MKHTAKFALALLVLLTLAPLTALASTELLKDATFTSTINKKHAKNVESPKANVYVFKKAGRYSGEIQVEFTVADPSKFTALTLIKSQSISKITLNGKAIPLPLAGMIYRTIPGIPTSLLKTGKNELRLKWSQTVKARTPKAKKGKPAPKPVPNPAKLDVSTLTLTLLGQTADALAFQTGPVLGHAGETFFTVSCRTNMIAPVTLTCGKKTYTSKPALLHTFKVDRLAPATKYSYSLTAQLGCCNNAVAKTSGPHTTCTLPTTMPFTFAALGDSRTSAENWAKVGGALGKVSPAPVLSVFVGDMVSAGRHDFIWDKSYFSRAKRYFASIPYYPIIGNHEQKAPLYLKLFQTPSGKTTWSQNVGGVLLIGIDDSEDFSAGSERVKWFEGLLAKSKAKYIFLFAHCPAWTSGSHGSITPDGLPKAPSIRNAQTVLLPLMKKYGGTAMVAGHDHFYERSEPTTGVTMIISGGAGAPLRSKVKDAIKQNPHSKVFERKLHYCLFKVTAKTCTMTVVTPDGKTIDTRTWKARKVK
jgi:hypothetical protein